MNLQSSKIGSVNSAGLDSHICDIQKYCNFLYGLTVLSETPVNTKQLLKQFASDFYVLPLATLDMYIKDAKID